MGIRLTSGLLSICCFLNTSLLPAYVDPVLDWNARALAAIRLQESSSPEAARALAMVHAAIYDSVNAITGEREPVHARVNVDTSMPVSVDAAVTSAAHRVLTHLYPDQAALFDHALFACYDCILNEDSRKAGIRVGREVADKIIAWRANDGATQRVAYHPGSAVGVWQPDRFKRAADSQWPQVTPFVIKDTDQFAPNAPPALSSEQYAQDYDEVKAFGRKQSRLRHSDQTASALFWSAGNGTSAGFWNAVATQIADREVLSTPQKAHLFAWLNLALADVGLAAWACKYGYCRWRPVDAIHAANRDGNPRTQVDELWKPMLDAPASPEYVSGHSAFGAAAATVLTAYFGDDVSFSANTEGEYGQARHFSSFLAAAEDAGRSRIYAGVHFQSANEAGARLGRQVACFVLSKSGRPCTLLD